MIVTYSWLKDFVEIKLKPEALAERLTMAGLEVTSLEAKDGDFIFEIEITSNRPDWLSIVGVAREVAAITDTKFRAYSVERRAYSQKLSAKRYPLNAEILKIDIESKKDCPLYSAKIIRNVKAGSSPEWLKKRLELIGCRSVNNIVDITNYVLFESGQPLHAFDLDKLSGGKIFVRRAKKDEKLITIDGQEKLLCPDILVISDRDKPAAIAGVMGGKETEVTESTKNILLESAVFNSVVVRRSRQKLGLQSESAYRFERGVNSGNVEAASNRAVSLIEEIAEGKCVLAKTSASPKCRNRQLVLRLSDVRRVLGVDIAPDKMKKILDSLGFKTREKAKNIFSVGIPSHRQDVNLEIDLIEEIARIAGYESIPETLPKITPQYAFCGRKELVSLTKNILVGLGLNEAITYSLIDKDLLGGFGMKESKTIEILNPLSKEQEIMRPAVLPSLALCAARNLNQKQDYINIFELAKVFLGTRPVPCEELVLGICLCGTKSLLLEQGLVREGVGFLHLKGIAEVLFGKLAISNYSFETAENPDIISICVNQEKIGLMMALEKNLLDKLGIKNNDVFGLEINLEKLFSFAQLEKKFVPLPKYPDITRDISFTLKEDTGITGVLAAIKEKGAPLLCAVKVSDYYKGKQIPLGYRGITISCLYRSDERTLTEEEITPVHSLICGLLTERFGAKIR